MREVVENLYLGDVVVKDRDRFVVIFSGFVQGSSAKGDYGIQDTMEYCEVRV
jgi:hypothetical protein